jgi:hypothetical protein
MAVAVGALALAACSDSPLSPTRSLRSSDADLSVTAGPGANQLTIVSDGSTLYCSTSQLNGDYTIPTSPYTAAGCGAGTLNLTAAINVYNPGWSQPFTGSSWIGITTKGGPSSDYRPNPGRYVFQETFTVPASVTAPVLDLHVKSDNVAAVYLNGTLIGNQPLTDCNSGTCNWNTDLHIVYNTAATFNIGGTNTLTFVVIDLPTGFPVTTAPTGGPAPQYGCPTRPFQVNGTAGYSATLVPTSPAHVVAGGGAGTALTNIGLANQAGCENPMGLDFAATVSWTPPVVTTWCSPGYWKNHLDAWSTADQNKLYSTLGSWAAPLSKKAPTSGPGSNPTLLQVVSDPSTYGGPATNSVADYLSNKIFGTPIGSGVESCPLN